MLLVEGFLLDGMSVITSVLVFMLGLVASDSELFPGWSVVWIRTSV